MRMRRKKAPVTLHNKYELHDTYEMETTGKPPAA